LGTLLERDHFTSEKKKGLETAWQLSNQMMSVFLHMFRAEKQTVLLKIRLSHPSSSSLPLPPPSLSPSLQTFTNWKKEK